MLKGAICATPGKPHVPNINFGKETIKNTILMTIALH